MDLEVADNLIVLANKIVLGPFLKYAHDYWPRQANNRNIKNFFDFFILPKATGHQLLFYTFMCIKNT